MLFEVFEKGKFKFEKVGIVVEFIFSKYEMLVK